MNDVSLSIVTPPIYKSSDSYIFTLSASTWRLLLIDPYPVMAEMSAITANTVPSAETANENTFYEISSKSVLY